MTKLGDIKWDKEKLPQKKRLSHEDKQAMAEYYQAALKTGKSAEEVLEELGERYGRSSRQIQRYISQKATEDLPNIATELKTQLSTPSPEFVLIDDLGSLGDNSFLLRQDKLSVVVESQSNRAGYKASSTATISGASLPRGIELFWTVSIGSIERYCPIERNPLFQHWLSSARLEKELTSWKRFGGSYLVRCRDTRIEIHESVKTRTPAGFIENVIKILPRSSSSPPEPMTKNFGNLVYQLAIEYYQSSGARGLPDESSYEYLPADSPIFVKLVFGQARIHLATSFGGVAQNWADLHRSMIQEWGRSKKIATLVNLFNNLQEIEAKIKEELN